MKIRKRVSCFLPPFGSPKWRAWSLKFYILHLNVYGIGGGSHKVKCVRGELFCMWWWLTLATGLLGSSLLADERLVDVWNDTATSDGCLDQAVKFLVSANGELQMARCDTLDFQVLRCVAGQLENLKSRHKLLTFNGQDFKTSAGSPREQQK